MTLERLRGQLSRYHPNDAAEALYVARMLELGNAARACDRDHFVPGHFTASAFVLSPDRRELVLIHHKKLGIWVQPGGHVEAGDESLERAAEREVAEEVGLTQLEPLERGPDARSAEPEGSTLFDVDIHEIPARKSDPAHKHFDVRFAFVARTTELVRSAEVADLRWVPLDSVAHITADRSVLRAVEKLRGRER